MLVSNRPSFGFTLIELLVAIAIIGVLMGLVIVVLDPAHFRNQAQDSRRLSELAQIQSALELSFADDNYYPSSIPSGVSTSDPDGNGYMYCPHSPAGGSGTDYMEYEVCTYMEVGSPSKCGSPAEAVCAAADACGTGRTCNCCLTNPF